MTEEAPEIPKARKVFRINDLPIKLTSTIFVEGMRVSSLLPRNSEGVEIKAGRYDTLHARNTNVIKFLTCITSVSSPLRQIALHDTRLWNIILWVNRRPPPSGPNDESLAVDCARISAWIKRSQTAALKIILVDDVLPSFSRCEVVWRTLAPQLHRCKHLALYRSQTLGSPYYGSSETLNSLIPFPAAMKILDTLRITGALLPSDARLFQQPQGDNPVPNIRTLGIDILGSAHKLLESLAPFSHSLQEAIFADIPDKTEISNVYEIIRHSSATLRKLRIEYPASFLGPEDPIVLPLLVELTIAADPDFSCRSFFIAPCLKQLIIQRRSKYQDNDVVVSALAPLPPYARGSNWPQLASVTVITPPSNDDDWVETKLMPFLEEHDKLEALEVRLDFWRISRLVDYLAHLSNGTSTIEKSRANVHAEDHRTLPLGSLRSLTLIRTIPGMTNLSVIQDKLPTATIEHLLGNRSALHLTVDVSLVDFNTEVEERGVMEEYGDRLKPLVEGCRPARTRTSTLANTHGRRGPQTPTVERIFPISDLPFELISKIFVEGRRASSMLPQTPEGLEINIDPYEGLRLRNNNVIKFLNLITSISSSLRQIALNDAHLWASIIWVGRQTPPSGPNDELAAVDRARISAYIERSQTAQLMIALIDYWDAPYSSSSIEAVWRIVASQLYRCYHLTLQLSRTLGAHDAGSGGSVNVLIPFPTPMKSLDTLSITGRLTPCDVSLFEQPQVENPVPKLKNLSINTVGSSHKLLGSLAPFPHALREAVLVETTSDLQVSNIYDIITSSSTTLEKLRIDYPASFLGPGNPILLPLLAELTIAADADFSFRQFLTTPNLQRLLIKRDFPYGPTVLSAPAASLIHAPDAWPHLISLTMLDPPSFDIGWLEETFLPILEEQNRLEMLDVCLSDGQIGRLVEYLVGSRPIDEAASVVVIDGSAANHNPKGHPSVTHPFLQSLCLFRKGPRMMRPPTSQERLSQETIAHLLNSRLALTLTVDAWLFDFDLDDEGIRLTEQYGERLVAKYDIFLNFSSTSDFTKGTVQGDYERRRAEVLHTYYHIGLCVAVVCVGVTGPARPIGPHGEAPEQSAVQQVFPINDLPFELISKIFGEGMRASSFLPRTPEGVEINIDPYEGLRLRNNNVIKFLNHITSISSSLRQIALKDTRLWAIIVWVNRRTAAPDPNDSSSITRDCARISNYLERSQIAPLKIILVDYAPLSLAQSEVIWHIIRPQLHRCKHLAIFLSQTLGSRDQELAGSLNALIPFPTAMESLETLGITGTLVPSKVTLFEQPQERHPLPNLRNLRIDIHGSHEALLKSLVPFPLSLREASFIDTVGGSEEPPMYGIIRSSSITLQKLRIDYPASFLGPTDPISLPLLTELTIAADVDLTFRRFLTTPNLERLLIQSKSSSGPEGIIFPSTSHPHARGSWPHLVSLIISNPPSSDIAWVQDKFLPILEELTKLEILEVSMSHRQIGKLVDYLARSPSFDDTTATDGPGTAVAAENDLSYAAGHPSTIEDIPHPMLRSLNLIKKPPRMFVPPPRQERVPAETVVRLLDSRVQLRLTVDASLVDFGTEEDETRLIKQYGERLKVACYLVQWDQKLTPHPARRVLKERIQKCGSSNRDQRTVPTATQTHLHHQYLALVCVHMEEVLQPRSMPREVHISDLPIELISSVFLEGMPASSVLPPAPKGAGAHKDPYGELRALNKNMTKYLNRISSISSFLRRIALRDPRLWTTIVWVNRRTASSGPNDIWGLIQYARIKAYLGRSQNISLKLMIINPVPGSISRCETVWRLVMPHLHRCAHLSLVICETFGPNYTGLVGTLDVHLPFPPAMKSLEALWITGPLTQSDVALFQQPQESNPIPNLRDLRLDIRGSHHNLLRNFISFPLSLRRVSIVDTTSDSDEPLLCELISSCSNTLQILEINHSGYMSTEDSILLPLLIELAIPTDKEFSFRKFLKTPSLKQLHIQGKTSIRSTTSSVTPSPLVGGAWPELISLRITTSPSNTIGWIKEMFLPILEELHELRMLEVCLYSEQIVEIVNYLNISLLHDGSGGGDNAASHPIIPHPMLQSLTLNRNPQQMHLLMPSRGQLSRDTVERLLKNRLELRLTVDVSIVDFGVEEVEVVRLIEQYGDRLRIESRG
ncbi:hypothetical protein DL93DRAFT_2158797 [Clavulina sp. PMI_390]|nr:hypothetical protein DL93DRAFT_2158797 [Clavulina sp. PMI_390]